MPLQGSGIAEGVEVAVKDDALDALCATQREMRQVRIGLDQIRETLGAIKDLLEQNVAQSNDVADRLVEASEKIAERGDLLTVELARNARRSE